MTSGAAGVLFYNNTILTETTAGSSANAHWRNNLILGENSAPAIFSVTTNTSYSSSDYNGFRPNRGADAAFQWSSPRHGVAADYGALEMRSFKSLADHARASGQDRHSVLVDYDVFVNVPPLDAKDRSRVQKVYKAEDLDFRLKAGSTAVDRGIALPNVTDGFAGSAPD